MIQNKGMSRHARRRKLSAYLDISGTTPLLVAVSDQDCDIKVQAISLAYVVATDAGTRPETLNVGVPGAATRYATVTPAASQGQNTHTTIAVSNQSTLVPAGTALQIVRSAAAGGTNTGEVVITVDYELIDRKHEN